MIAAVVPPDNWVSFILAAGLILGGIGYALGTFSTSRRKGVGESLRTALDEVEAMKLRADRLENEVADLRKAIDDNHKVIEKLRKENEILRSVKVSTDITEAVTKG